MANIVLLGAGVMASALASVAAVNNNVTIVGSPLDDHIIECIKKKEKHPDLEHSLPGNVVAITSYELTDGLMQSAAVIVIGVSSPGVEWALELIQRHKSTPNILALVTKGLVSNVGDQSVPRTYAQMLERQLTSPVGRIVGIGGPCIARELALAFPTRVCFAAHDLTVADELRQILATDYYHVATHNDFTGLEACAALKNFMCVGVSTMFTAYKIGDGFPKNPLAALFNQAVQEINLLSHWIKANIDHIETETSTVQDVSNELAFDLAGLGDLHVTVGGGRNSKLGQHLGTGRKLSDILSSDMLNVTVEGIQTGQQLLPGFRKACDEGSLEINDFPLCCAILDVIEYDKPFTFNFEKLPA